MFKRSLCERNPNARHSKIDLSFSAMTLQNSILNPNDPMLRSVSELGSMLFTRGVSGTRVITGRDEKIFNYDHVFKGELYIFYRKNSSSVLTEFALFLRTVL